MTTVRLSRKKIKRQDTLTVESVSCTHDQKHDNSLKIFGEWLAGQLDYEEIHKGERA